MVFLPFIVVTDTSVSIVTDLQNIIISLISGVIVCLPRIIDRLV